MKNILEVILLIIPFYSIGQTSATLEGNDMYYGVDAWGQLFQANGRFSMWTFDYASHPNAFPSLTHRCELIANGYTSSGEYYDYFDTVGFEIQHTAPLSSTSHLPIDWSGAYHHVWIVSGSNVLAHIADFEDNGIIDGDIDEELLRYPALGNPFFTTYYGVDAPEEALAPFFDRNDNAIYEPQLGDYPIIDDAYPNTIPNAMSFTVWNDIGLDRSLGCEFSLMTFSFDCEEDTELNRTIFTKTTITNKSNRDYYDFVVGHLYDFDLGCPDDDFVGTYEAGNTAYLYNSDEFDGDADSTCDDLNRRLAPLGNNPGVVSSTLLNANLSTNVAFSRGSRINSSFNLIPTMRAALSRGVIYIPQENDTIYMDTIGIAFPDFPTIMNGDHMPAANYSPYDYRLVPASQIGDFIQGDKIQLYHAYAYSADTTLNAYEEAANLENTIPVIQAFFDNGLNTNCTQIISTCVADDCVWPGDVNADGIVLGDDLLALQYAKINNFQGAPRDFVGQFWARHDATDWTYQIDALDVNGKHADCFGDGVVTNHDAEAWRGNHRQKKSGIIEPPLIRASEQTQNLEANVFWKRIPETASPIRKRLPGLLDFTLPQDEAYLGFKFSIIIDEDIFVKDDFFANDDYPASDGLYITSIISYPDENRKDIVFATNRYDSLAANSYTPVFGNLYIREDLRVPEDLDSLYIPYPIYNLQAMNMDGEYVDLGFKMDSVWLIKQYSDTEVLPSNFSIDISPNPANQAIYISASQLIKQIQLISVTGQIMLNKKTHAYKETILTPNIPEGMYLLKLIDNNGVESVKRILIQH